MKFLLVTVSIIAVCAAEFQALRNKPRGDQHLSEESEGQGETEDQQTKMAVAVLDGVTGLSDFIAGEDASNLTYVKMLAVAVLDGVTGLSEQQTSTENFIAGEDASNLTYVKMIDDMEILVGRSRWCRSRGGQCGRPNKFSCPGRYQESPKGRPYCMSKKRRCCYPAVCPKGFFNVPGSANQCFKFFNDVGLSWNDSLSKCQNESLEMAKPVNPVAVRLYLVEHFAINGTDAFAWMGARGNGTAVLWIQDGTVVGRNNPAWYTGSGSSKRPGPNECLLVLSNEHWMGVDPTGPYQMNGCSGTNKYALCELVVE